MAAISLPTTLDSKTILVVDDEPEHIEWMIDYIHAKKLKTLVTNNVAQAIEAVNKSQFRGYIIDLNIPMGGWQPAFKAPSNVYEKYMGFYVIKYVRTQGNKGINVIAYSAHRNEQIVSEIEALYCGYVAKGRAKEFKQGIDDILSLPLGVKSQLVSTKSK